MDFSMPSDLAALRGVPSLVWRAGQERRLQMLAQWTRLEQARVFIDGIGVGTYARELRARYTPYVDGIDIEFERIEEAREFAPHAVVAAAEHLPYPTETFDTLLSHEVIEHVQ